VLDVAGCEGDMREKWISVKERLPDDGERVLTWGSRGYLFCEVAYRAYDEWWRSMDGIWLFDVTHWMSLPEGPKELSL